VFGTGDGEVVAAGAIVGVAGVEVATGAEVGLAGAWSTPMYVWSNELP
jgi:hypothetical protein